MAGRTTRAFWRSISALGDPLSLQLIAAVMRGRAPSLLELPDRPAAYEDVGRLCRWDDLFPLTLLPRSRFERVLGHAIAGRRVHMDGCWHRPIGVRGWTHVVFRRERDGARRVMSLDEMLTHLDAWDRTADRRMAERRIAAMARREIERRKLAERRAKRAALERHRREIDKDNASPAPAAAKDVRRPSRRRRWARREWRARARCRCRARPRRAPTARRGSGARGTPPPVPSCVPLHGILIELLTPVTRPLRLVTRE